MNLMASWQLMLFLCAISFRETLEKVAPMENPRSTDQKLGPLALPPPWERSQRCAPAKSAPEPGRLVLRAPGRRLIPAPRGAALVQREKDLPAYNWNSFGLRYGRRRAAPRDGAPGREAAHAGRGASRTRGAAGGGAAGGDLQFPS
ncbi:metastasis-suppressor KiSS-1 [Rhinolophus sinicus]|uniref:metastasis-suppressor KiSS-1 n=1 Tax=Rhinolophus sinicus TaxID=89399 RepID=UPI003D78FF90